MRIAGQKWTVWLRDILLGGLIIFVVLQWQERDLVATDGTVVIENRALVSLDGEELSLLANDKPTLIYFFAPWCQVCHLSIGNLDYIDSDKVAVVRVALDYPNVEDVAEFVQKHEIDAPILLGDRALQREFGIKAYPTYYVINKSHEVVAGTQGYSTALGLKLRQVFNTEDR